MNYYSKKNAYAIILFNNKISNILINVIITVLNLYNIQMSK